MKGSEVSNILIIESEADKFFIEALLNHININLKVAEPICFINEFDCLGGISRLEEKLNSLFRRVKRDEIKNIGIIFDADNVGMVEREKEIREKIKSVFGEYDETIFSIYILNLNGKGELEDILKAIKTEESPYSDCLYYWKECLDENDMEVSNKIFNKFWINNYIMYDTCTTSRDRGKKSKYCVFEYAMKEKSIWNFDHKILDNLKEFLKELGENNE